MVEPADTFTVMAIMALLPPSREIIGPGCEPSSFTHFFYWIFTGRVFLNGNYLAFRDSQHSYGFCGWYDDIGAMVFIKIPGPSAC